MILTVVVTLYELAIMFVLGLGHVCVNHDIDMRAKNKRKRLLLDTFADGKGTRRSQAVAKEKLIMAYLLR